MATHFANTFVHDAGWFVNDIIEFFGRCIIRHHLCGFLASSYAYTALDVLQLVVANDDKSHMPSSISKALTSFTTALSPLSGGASSLLCGIADWVYSSSFSFSLVV